MNTYQVTVITTVGEFTLSNVGGHVAPELCSQLINGRPLDFDHKGTRYCIPAAQILCLSWRHIAGGTQ